MPANAIGKWMLNAANAARLFYPEYMPDEHETIPQLAGVTKGVIGYEGIIRKSSYPQYENVPAPVDQGDGPLWVPGKNPEESQFSIYGSAHAGIFGGIIRATNVPGILQLDVLATDFFHDDAYPSYLFFNPYAGDKLVVMNIEKGKSVDLYNTVSAQFIARNVSSSAQIKLPAKQAALIVSVPTGGKLSYEGGKMSVNGVVVDYRYGER